jgi:hypothetical protein
MRFILLPFLFFISPVFAEVHNGNKNPSGTWIVDGIDKTFTRWEAKLVLMPRDGEEYPPKNFKGYFDWKGSNSTGGREFILASFDYDTNILKIKGTELQSADNNIKTTIYTAFMSEFDFLKDGVWGSCGAVPGEWSARKINDQPLFENKRGPRKKQTPKINCDGVVCEIE